MCLINSLSFQHDHKVIKHRLLLSHLFTLSRVKGSLLCLAVVKYISRTDGTQTHQTAVSLPSQALYLTTVISKVYFPWSEAPAVPSHLQRELAAHSASPWLTQLSQTLRPLCKKRRTDVTAKTSFSDRERRLFSQTGLSVKAFEHAAFKRVSIYFGCSRHQNRCESYQAPGVSYSCPSRQRWI